MPLPRSCFILIGLALGVFVSGCGQSSAPPVETPARPAATAREAPKSLPAAKPPSSAKEGALEVKRPVGPASKESEAVQAARKLGTPSQNRVVTTSSGLQYIDVKQGKGDPATIRDAVSVHYTGWLVDGSKFDSSLDRGQPFTLTLGEGMVIKGWEEGLTGMKPGGVRKLIIPAQLGYGERGAGGGRIPPNSTLIFQVELIKIAPRGR